MSTRIDSKTLCKKTEKIFFEQVFLEKIRTFSLPQKLLFSVDTLIKVVEKIATN